jgi:hypothetical protein
MAVPSLVTIPNVPIVEAGMEWPASTGPITITREHLESMVTAANDDPLVPTAKLKLTLVNDTHGTPITEPSFGRATNLRLDEGELTVYADFEGVPKWLADVLPAAYPNRSVEILWGAKLLNGKKWPAIIESVQLLGVEWPGCLSLQDLPLFYGDKQPEVVQVKLGGQMAKTAASVNTEKVRRGYYDLLNEQGNYSWWVKGILLDDGTNGDQLVVEDEGKGELYLVPFSIDGSDVEYGEPKAVEIEYVPKPETKEEKTKAVAFFAAGIMHERKVLASYATPEESGRVVKEKGGSTMDEAQRKTLSKKLGLGDDATEEQIQAKLLANATAELDPDAQTEGTPATPPATPATPTTPATPETPPATQPTTPTTPTTPATPAAPAQPETREPEAVGAMSVDKGTLAQLQADAKAGREARQTQLAAAKESLLVGAIKEGKFPPARKQHWSDYYDRDPEGAKAAIDGLAAGLIPLDERGTTAGGEGTELVAGSGDAYPQGWFPEVEKRRAALKAAQERGSRVVSEVM